jgi:hypothetical protein
LFFVLLSICKIRFLSANQTHANEVFSSNLLWMMERLVEVVMGVTSMHWSWGENVLAMQGKSPQPR